MIGSIIVNEENEWKQMQELEKLRSWLHSPEGEKQMEEWMKWSDEHTRYWVNGKEVSKEVYEANKAGKCN